MCKKFISAAVCAAMLAAAPAALCEDDIKVILDGSAMSFEVPPQIINDRTLVPLRAIFEALGADVEWDEDTRTVTAEKDGTVLSLAIDSYVMTVGERMVELDSPAVIIDDRTLVPARAVSESFGADVEWDEDTRTVIITTDGSEPTAAPTIIPTASPQPAPIQTAVPETSGTEEPLIEYDSASEQNVAFMRGFEILSAEKNENGDYDISYTLRTFKEGSGDVIVMFDCYDASGKLVDTFGDLFRGTDYTWSVQEADAVISGDTALIRFSADKSSV